MKKLNDVKEILEKLNDASKIDASIKVVEEIKRGTKRVPHNHINILYLLKEVMGDSCKNYLEIGTLWGGSMGVVLQSKFSSNFYGLDLFVPFFADKIDITTVSESIKKLNKHEHFFELIKGDCSDPKIIDLVNKKIPNGVDLLFIDGDHAQEAVVRDFNNFKHIVNKDGFIVFDDYAFLSTVKDAVDQLNLDEFNIIGRSNSGIKNSHLNELKQPNLNASYIIQKK